MPPGVRRRLAVQQPAARDAKRDHRQHGRDVVAAVERRHRVHLLFLVHLHGHDADDGGDDPEGARDQREHHHADDAHAEVHPRLLGRRGEPRAEDHRADVLGRGRLEQVRATAGAVADVVADQVGDHRRVARVVLGDARLDLADQIGADVGGLGVDPAAELREERDEGGAEAVADDEQRDLGRLDVRRSRSTSAKSPPTPSRLIATTSRPETAPPRSAMLQRVVDARERGVRGADVGCGSRPTCRCSPRRPSRARRRRRRA